jgi:predicted O-methyltransferase YrrM
MELSWMNKSLKRRPKNIPGFEGRFYRKFPDYEWAIHIPMPNGPINYLEIGSADGGTAILISKSFAKHPGSRIYCVDPWMDYDDYPEYKGQQEQGYNTFLSNINKLADINKFVIKRGLSHDIVPTFENNFFDIIFVDGNHETKYVYQDGIMALQKVKVGGYIIFDDYLVKGWEQTKVGIDNFITEFKHKLDIVYNGQRAFGQIILRRKL